MEDLLAQLDALLLVVDQLSGVQAELPVDPGQFGLRAAQAVFQVLAVGLEIGDLRQLRPALLSHVPVERLAGRQLRAGHHQAARGRGQR